MFDQLASATPSLEDLRRALSRLAAVDGAGVDEAGLIAHLTALEELKSALAAAQARVTMNLVNARTISETNRGVPARRRCQGLAAEIALATRQSPHSGVRNLGFARALVQEMPRTLSALASGEDLGVAGHHPGPRDRRPLPRAPHAGRRRARSPPSRPR